MRGSDHQFDRVKLIDVAGAGIIVNGYNVGIWECLSNLFDNTFTNDKGASAIIPVDEDGKIILVRQYRGAIDDLLLEIPAGGRDSLEEDFLVCAARELEEEIGYRGNANQQWIFEKC